MPEADSLAVLRKHQYKALSLPDPGMLLLARVGKTQQEVLASGEAGLTALDLGAEEIGVVATAAEADRAWRAVSIWIAHHVDITLAEGGALATVTGEGGYGDRSAVCGEAPMAEGQHWAEFAAVKKGYGNIYVGVVPADAAGKVAGMTDGWWFNGWLDLADKGDAVRLARGAPPPTDAFLQEYSGAPEGRKRELDAAQAALRAAAAARAEKHAVAQAEELALVQVAVRGQAATELAHGFALEGSAVPGLPDGVFAPSGE